MVSKEFLVQHFQGKVTPTNEIDGVAEQQFSILLQQKFPGLTLVYQPTTFTWENLAANKTQSTLPDFLFINPNNGSVTFIEITMHYKNGDDPKNGTDPKREQKEVMLKGNSNIRYVVLYREHLEKIQKKNLYLSFFNGKKVRK